MTPKLVRLFIEDAVERGWYQRQTPDMADFDERMAPRWTPRHSEDELGIAAWPVAEVSTVEHTFAWPHSCADFYYCELTADTSNADIGNLVAAWCDKCETDVLATDEVFEVLCSEDPYVSGGLVWRLDGAVVVKPGCCTSLDEWQQWRTFLQDGKFWGGHDPWVSLEAEENSICIRPGTREGRLVRLNYDGYLACLNQVENHLRAFALRLADWVTDLSPSSRDKIIDWFRRAASLHEP